MIDLHCHLLPGIDDGAQTMDESVELFRHAVRQGITRMVCTPHLHIDRYDNTIDTIRRTWLATQQQLQQEQIPIEIAFAAEVRLDAAILPLFERNKIPFLGEWQGEKVVLLELPHSHIPPGTEKLIAWLHKRGIQTMIAHPERNKDVIREVRTIKPLIQAGCLFQVTAGSAAGQFGEVAATRAKQLIKAGRVTILASDAHHIKRRPPEMEIGRQVAERLIGESAAWDLVETHPRLISDCLFLANEQVGDSYVD